MAPFGGLAKVEAQAIFDVVVLHLETVLLSLEVAAAQVVTALAATVELPLVETVNHQPRQTTTARVDLVQLNQLAALLALDIHNVEPLTARLAHLALVAQEGQPTLETVGLDLVAAVATSAVAAVALGVTVARVEEALAGQIPCRPRPRPMR